MKQNSLIPDVSRKSLAWLLVTQVFLLIPLFFTIPLWIAAVWGVVGFWRWKILQGAWNYPNKIHKTIIVLFSTIALVVNFGLHYSLEAMLSLLVLGFVLKLLEIKNQKDFVLLILIAVFLLPTQFILFNSLLSGVYGVLTLILLLTSLNTLYYANTFTAPWKSFRANALILLQAVPFMLILFVVMPRLGSFWAMPSPHQLKTGMSDSMAPGVFTELMESAEPAFRATFDGTIPAPDQRYWRSLVFSQFDGKRWMQSRQQLNQIKINSPAQKNIPWLKNITYIGMPLRYTIVAEPTGQPWLYSLAIPQEWDNKLQMNADAVLQNTVSVNQRLSYKVVSSLKYKLSADTLTAEELVFNTALPENGNLKTREKAKEWLSETGSPEKLIEKLFNYYHSSFDYTLRPPALAADYIDDFLWDKRRGFCEHFSSSFVFFLRAAGIPARVVVGYQGGEINSVDNYLLIRQRDAHAWAEVWLKGRGWVMFDPTAAVAPERVQKGIDESLSATDRQLLARPFGSSFKLLRKLRDQVDALNYQWVRWVLNYDSGSQDQLFKRLLDDVTPLKIALWVLVVGVSVILVIVAGLFFRSRKQSLSASQQVYRLLCNRLKRVGIEPLQGESPTQFLVRTGSLRPDLRHEVELIAGLFEQFSYAEKTSVERDLSLAVNKFSPKKLKMK